MARQRQRFSRLFDQLKATKGTPAPGSTAANFLLFLNGTNNIEQVNKPPAGSKKRFVTSVIPFSLNAPGAVAATATYKVEVSAYSLSGRTARFPDISAAELGWNDVAPGTNSTGDFYPAIIKIVMTRSGAAANPSKKSAVTQENYAYTPRRSFSLPFGRPASALTDDEYTRKVFLAGELAGVNGFISVSFVPEEFQLAASGAGLSAAPAITVG